MCPLLGRGTGERARNFDFLGKDRKFVLFPSKLPTLASFSLVLLLEKSPGAWSLFPRLGQRLFVRIKRDFFS